ncbi:hypothetical protein [Lysinibacillus odysseyi]|uniref:Uncharacterized protein n=1 Tax=Lysinibacillus odysseyi 34hs-1 = NBRC 100172 TaxID=1220589 RepID=A0A0A3IRN2_9BACI|nr:hypothetical protein [Lysinibacillus odysseyi]KGR87424.1 hypothetical protein CD32_03775 [Lysinibacillus odysseyi 34hs-1 = NBRC 100172]
MNDIQILLWATDELLETLSPGDYNSKITRNVMAHARLNAVQDDQLQLVAAAIKQLIEEANTFFAVLKRSEHINEHIAAMHIEPIRGEFLKMQAALKAV